MINEETIANYRAGRYIRRNADACIQELCNEVERLRETIKHLEEHGWQTGDTWVVSVCIKALKQPNAPMSGGA